MHFLIQKFFSALTSLKKGFRSAVKEISFSPHEYFPFDPTLINASQRIPIFAVSNAVFKSLNVVYVAPCRLVGYAAIHRHIPVSEINLFSPGDRRVPVLWRSLPGLFFPRFFKVNETGF